jgi:hypothetical protein
MSDDYPECRIDRPRVRCDGWSAFGGGSRSHASETHIVPLKNEKGGHLKDRLGPLRILRVVTELLSHVRVGGILGICPNM